MRVILLHFLLLVAFSNLVCCEKDESASDVKILSTSEQEAAARAADQESTFEDSSQEKSKKEENSADSKGEDKHSEGSICYYCSYCKLCQHCEKECPCEPTASKPQCNLCKYCQYCHLCSSVCDSVCQPGGFLDTISSAIYKTFPPVDSKFKESFMNDLESVKDWAKQFL